jgi:hypothetical protein
MTDDVTRPGHGDAVASPADLRASHADRDQAVELLRIAAGDGRLTAEELDERLETALTARTCGELAALTADLPASPGRAAATLALSPDDLVCVDCRGSNAKRDGQWVVPRRMQVLVTSGSVLLDFTEAVIFQPSLQIDAEVSSGRLTIVAPPGVVVDASAVAAENSYVKVLLPASPDVPVTLRIRVSGKVSDGHIVARPPRRSFRQRLRG